MSNLTIGCLGISFLFLQLFAGLPIAFALFTSGIVGVGLLVGFTKSISLCATIPFEAVSIYSLTAIPAFIAMGALARRAALTENFFQSASKWFSGVKGGLAIASVVAAAAFAAVTGSSVAAVSALAPLTIPDMLKRGYDRRLAAGSVAAGNMLGILIPPSITMVIYGELTGMSIGKCLMAGILPGVVSVMAFAIGIIIWVNMKPKTTPAPFFTSFKTKVGSLPKTWRLFTIIVLIFGGIYSGFFTPTEAGACAAFVCLVFCIFPGKSIKKVESMRSILSALKESAVTSGMIFAVIIGAKLFDEFLVLTGVPTALANWITVSNFPKMLVLWMILLTYIPLGMLLDGASMILITVPIYAPVLKLYGFDLIQIAVLVTAMVELGLITPPMGLNAFVIKAALPELSLEKDIFAGCLVFIIIQIIVIFILAYVPQISLAIPNLM